MAVSLMLNVSQNYWKLDNNNFHFCAPLRTTSQLIFTVSCLPQNLMLPVFLRFGLREHQEILRGHYY